MKVFKFGGASVKDAQAIDNVASIIQSFSSDQLLVVISAMGKTTDVLEQVVALAQTGKSFAIQIDQIRTYHTRIMEVLFPAGHPVFADFELTIRRIETDALSRDDYDEVYDQVVSAGELMSTRIISQYLLLKGLAVQWLDSRTYIRTDRTFREGKVDWAETRRRVEPIRKILEEKIIITPGFLGSTPEGTTTTLGREGSDFSAAIFASSLKASSVTIWKDVAGVMNADPKRLPNAKVFDELPFKEAAEMTYYGAAIIHPKTIKPLANAGIPLHVKSFINPALPGTVIHECKIAKLPPLIVHKGNQCLISCQVTDYSFINEQQIGNILQTLNDHNLKINVMQNSAISFSFCVDYRENKILKLIQDLSKYFEVYYNTGLTLITIKNYDAALYQEYRNQKGVMLEQSSRSTLQVLVKD